MTYLSIIIYTGIWLVFAWGTFAIVERKRLRSLLPSYFYAGRNTTVLDTVMFDWRPRYHVERFGTTSGELYWYRTARWLWWCVQFGREPKRTDGVTRVDSACVACGRYMRLSEEIAGCCYCELCPYPEEPCETCGNPECDHECCDCEGCVARREEKSMRLPGSNADTPEPIRIVEHISGVWSYHLAKDRTWNAICGRTGMMSTAMPLECWGTACQNDRIRYKWCVECSKIADSAGGIQ